MQNSLPKRFYPSGLNNTFRGQGLDFLTYIATMRDIITKTRVDLQASDNPEKIITANSPYEKRPDHPHPSRGVLLIHGLFDSPYMMTNIAEHLVSKGFWVRSILLPGHGTLPGDLVDIDYQAWVDAVEYGIDNFSKEVENVYLAGFSIGGALSLYHALRQPRVKALLLFSPAFKLKLEVTAAAHFFKLYEKFTNNGQWARIAEDTDYAKYESVCWNAVRQTYLLIKKLNPLNAAAHIRIPIFIAASGTDSTVHTQTTLKFFSRHRVPASQFILYSNKQHAFKDSRIEVRPSAYPSEHIINFSHTCIPIAPHNPHYGRHRDYTPSVGMEPDSQKEIRYGEKSKKLHKQYRLCRLTYNPDFDQLMLKMDQFLSHLK